MSDIDMEAHQKEAIRLHAEIRRLPLVDRQRIFDAREALLGVLAVYGPHGITALALVGSSIIVQEGVV